MDKKDLEKALGNLGLSVKDGKVAKAEIENVLAAKKDDLAIKKQLDAELKAAGVTSITASYSGSGDSGDMDHIEYFPKAPRNTALENKVHDFLWQLTDVHHPGWENNDGGSGEFNWEVGGQLSLSHLEYHMDSTEYNYTWK